MQELTKEWGKKAEDDFTLAELAMSGGEAPIPDGVCFHAQQCAEKYLKAYLQENNVEFPRTHNLIPLLELCRQLDSEFDDLRDPLIALESYGIAVRYPGFNASLPVAQGALEAAAIVREFIRARL